MENIPSASPWPDSFLVESCSPGLLCTYIPPNTPNCKDPTFKQKQNRNKTSPFSLAELQDSPHHLTLNQEMLMLLVLSNFSAVQHPFIRPGERGESGTTSVAG